MLPQWQTSSSSCDQFPQPKFRGADNGDGANLSSRLILGPEGSLCGATSAGGYTGNNCGTGGNNGCGTVFNLKPPATTCPTALCGWTETVLYSFKGYVLGDRGTASCSLQKPPNRPARQSLRLPADGGDGIAPVGDIASTRRGTSSAQRSTGRDLPAIAAAKTGPAVLSTRWRHRMAAGRRALFSPLTISTAHFLRAG